MAEIASTSIRKRLIVIQLATAFMAVLICCGFFVYNDVNVFRESSIKTKQSIAEIIGLNATPALEFADQDAAAEMLLKLRSNPSILNAAIFDKDGKLFARYNKPGEEQYTFPSAQNEFDLKKDWQQFTVSYQIITTDKLGSVMLRAELTGFKEMIVNYLKVVLLILVISIVAAFIISSLLQRTITNRLLALVTKTKEVADTGDYSIRVGTEGTDEISTLSIAFNKMLAQIERMQQVLKGTNEELERRVKIRTVELEAANAELERFVYVASHDLQEPLRTISNYVGILEEDYSLRLDEMGNKHLTSLGQAARRMRQLILDLLELSRIGKDVKMTRVNTNDVLREVIAQLNAAIDESKTTITGHNLPVIKGNELELKQLFQNLISNAIKFRKKTGPSEIKITAEDKGSEYLFAFKDNGIGIEEKYKDKIFVVFQRLHGKSEYPGTGIGLATCQKIVSIHKGRIWVESKPGEGSTFYFTVSKNL